uniref:disintegrin and metalloproteinase domain-containing protein 20-like n=1 Tax=Jaculus jaculus TaxID=51337 RepID=UPI001E1B30BC|nr:disintegrin and metalloproteinase domain-containing protein 20-like [Jaculus jaculus]
MGFAWAQALRTHALWLPVLWTLLFPISCSHGPPRWHFTSSEIVIPKKVPLSSSLEQLAYRVHFRGQRHVIRMKLKKNMVPRHLPVLTDNDQGAPQEDYPFVPRDCYFYSYLEGVPGSVATLDTCYGGLHGMLQVDDFTYEIKPLVGSSKFEHVISLLASGGRAKGSERCSIGEEEPSQLLEKMKLAETPRAGPTYLWRIHRKHLRLLYTVSNSLFRMKSGNVTNLIEIIIIINSILDTIFKPAGLNVLIRVVCIWDKEDKVELNTNNVWKTVSEYGLHKQHFFFSAIPHSSAVLLTGHNIAGTVYHASPDGMCSPNWGAMYVSLLNLHIYMSATILAHAVCHNFGNGHDGPGCVCFRRTSCVMAPVPGLMDMLSNCTYTQLHLKLNGWDTCLSTLNHPYDNYPYVTGRCGNGVRDKTEECDCGSFKQCATNKCCATDCMLTPGSVCDKGGCCHHCKYSAPGMICRDKLGICDLREYCNGTSEECPPDFHIQDGTPCSAVAVCMQGNCSDRSTQCRALFGYNVKDASPTCYKVLNVRGDSYGNCGVKVQRGRSKLLRCEDDNAFCGLLHCDNIGHYPGGDEHTSFHHIKLRDIKEVECFGYEAHHGTGLPEMGLVADGATCGPGKFCRRQNCTLHQDMGYSCDIQRCNFRGVCNNRNHCHCEHGWKPPLCDQRGVGGSEDSGPPPSKDAGLGAKIISNINWVLLVCLFRCILFMVSILGGKFAKTNIDVQNVPVGCDSQ